MKPLREVFRSKKVLAGAACVLLPLLLSSLHNSSPAPEWDGDTRLSSALRALGEEPPRHFVKAPDSTLVRKGEALIRTGKARGQGFSSRKQSLHFVCTDCHNTVREDPDLSVSDPEARLRYAREQDIPFLQGTTLYGVVNRESWYNGDYVKKYGELARDARDTLPNAIQLCATACSQGRAFTEKELKAVLHYLWSIELRLKDLDLPLDKIDRMARISQERPAKKKKLLEWLRNQYLQGAPATFVKPLNTNERTYGDSGNVERGKAIYNKSCQHCHQPGGVTRYTLDHNKLTFRQLARNLDNYTDKSIYQITRYGTSPKKGYRPYMPHYTKERLSDQQIEDLAAYIQEQL